MGSLGKSWQRAAKAADDGTLVTPAPLNAATFGVYDRALEVRETTIGEALHLLAGAIAESATRRYDEVGTAKLVCGGIAERLRHLPGLRDVHTDGPQREAFYAINKLAEHLERDAATPDDQVKSNLGSHRIYLVKQAHVVEALAQAFDQRSDVAAELAGLAAGLYMASATETAGNLAGARYPQRTAAAIRAVLEQAPKPWDNSPGAVMMRALLDEIDGTPALWAADTTINRNGVVRRWAEAIGALADLMQPITQGIVDEQLVPPVSEPSAAAVAGVAAELAARREPDPPEPKHRRRR